MAKDPAYPMYAQDFDMDTASWSALAVGVYIRLMNYSWINGPLPDDTEELARITRLDHGNFKKVWCRYVISKWTKTNEGLVNSRMEIERQKRVKYVEQQRSKGIKSGQTRTNHGSTTVQPKGQPEGNLSFSSSSSTSKKKNTKVVFVLPEDISPEIWDAFVEHRKILKKPLTDHAKKLLIQKLEKIGQDKNAVLNQAIEKGWQSVFPLSENSPLFQQQQPTQSEDPIEKAKRRMGL